jgi:hypothetical protein
MVTMDDCPGELLWCFEAHRLKVIPPRWILQHGDPMLIAQDDTGTVEDTPDRRIELARHLRFGSPYRAQYCGHVESCYLVDWAIK